jgi:predicted RNase H-like HicB family nuclease
MKSRMTATLATLGVAVAGALLSTLAYAVEATQPAPVSTSVGKTRAEVKAELADAIRTGDIASGISGLKLNEVYPGSYPRKPSVATKTREEVNAELAEAVRTGDIVTGQTGSKAYEQFPGRYPPRPAVAGKTREEVKAELAEAIRNGDIVAGEGGLRLRDQSPGNHARSSVRTTQAETATVQAR